MSLPETETLPRLAGGRHERADHLRRDPEALARLAKSGEARFLMPCADGESLYRDCDPVQGDADLCFLGFDADERPLFLSVAHAVTSEGMEVDRSAWALLAAMTREQAGLFATMRALIHWHHTHRHCGRCGGETVIGNGGWMRECTSCSTPVFPRTDPVVIMLAEHDGRVLLGRQPRFPKGHYSALAGFVEPGENLEDAVVRELREEAGITVHSPLYVASQPWPFPASLMVGYIAQCDDPEIMIDTDELEDAFWADRNDVALALAKDSSARFIAPPSLAIAHHLLRHWFEQTG